MRQEGRQQDEGVILAIWEGPRGFGYNVFEAEDFPLDWGVKVQRERRLRGRVLNLEVLMHMLQPSVLVIEDTHHASSRRYKRTRTFLDRVAELAEKNGVQVKRYARDDVLKVFGKLGAETKDDIAEKVVERLPEMADSLPRRRTLGDSERYAMPMFEAAALALTHFDR